MKKITIAFIVLFLAGLTFAQPPVPGEDGNSDVDSSSHPPMPGEASTSSQDSKDGLETERKSKKDKKGGFFGGIGQFVSSLF